MSFIRGTVLIETKFTDEAKENAAKTVCEWADKHEMYVRFGWNDKGDYLCEYEKKGRTQAFCKGHAAELKKIIKTCLNAKATTIFEAW